jgi:hypothetical protein
VHVGIANMVIVFVVNVLVCIVTTTIAKGIATATRIEAEHCI